jgi:protein-tyrosine phosphatase
MKILMVCLGNICRSPLAEGVLRHQLNEAGIKHVTVDSAGTSGHHSGENPDPRSIRNAKKNGVDISSLVSRKFTPADFDNFDRIYVMDQSNYRDVLSLAQDDEHRNKVELFLNISSPGKNKAVPDPWYGGEEGFQRVFDLVHETCCILVDQIKSQK